MGSLHIKSEKIHPVEGRDPTPCGTIGIGTWNEKIIHFMPDKEPSSAGDETHSEYFVPLDNFLNAIEDLYKIRDKFIDLV